MIGRWLLLWLCRSICDPEGCLARSAGFEHGAGKVCLSGVVLGGWSVFPFAIVSFLQEAIDCQHFALKRFHLQFHVLFLILFKEFCSDLRRNSLINAFGKRKVNYPLVVLCLILEIFIDLLWFSLAVLLPPLTQVILRRFLQRWTSIILIVISSRSYFMRFICVLILLLCLFSDRSTPADWQSWRRTFVKSCLF